MSNWLFGNIVQGFPTCRAPVVSDCLNVATN